MDKPQDNTLAEHLRRWPGLWVRKGDAIVRALEEDVQVAKSYPAWVDKGELVRGQRLTIMAARRRYQLGETVRVIHVFEVVEPGSAVYVMGPKPVLGEYVDEQLVTPPAVDGEAALRPRNYDGPTLPSPAVDYNFDITSYTFAEPGTHRIMWKVDDLVSNDLSLEVES